MKKIPTLFKREFDKRHRIISCDPDFSTPELGEWVLNDCIPTVKVDGSCCAIINGEFYKRYDARKGKTLTTRQTNGSGQRMKNSKYMFH